MNQEQKDALNRKLKSLGDIIDTVLLEANLAEQRLYPNRIYSLYDVKPNLFDGLEVAWETGGSEGGGLDGNRGYALVESHQFTNDTQPPELTSLLVVIDELFPDISFKEGRKLLEMVVIDNFRVNGYYSNYQNFSRKRISIKDIHDWTQAYGITPKEPHIGLSR